MAESREKSHEKALEAIKDFMEWGAKTGSDRDLFDNRFREILREAGIEFEEPDYGGKSGE